MGNQKSFGAPEKIRRTFSFSSQGNGLQCRADALLCQPYLLFLQYRKNRIEVRFNGRGNQAPFFKAGIVCAYRIGSARVVSDDASGFFFFP
jgi:hypothetical protein